MKCTQMMNLIHEFSNFVFPMYFKISSQNVYNMDWFRSLIIFDDSIDENSVDEAVADLIPQLFEKVVCPRVTGNLLILPKLFSIANLYGF